MTAASAAAAPPTRSEPPPPVAGSVGSPVVSGTTGAVVGTPVSPSSVSGSAFGASGTPVRDAAGPETTRIVTDDLETHQALEHFVTEFVAEPRPTVEHYTGKIPLFDEMKLEEQILITEEGPQRLSTFPYEDNLLN